MGLKKTSSILGKPVDLVGLRTEVEVEVGVRLPKGVLRVHFVRPAIVLTDVEYLQREDVVVAADVRRQLVPATILDDAVAMVPGDGGGGVGAEAHLKVHAGPDLPDGRLRGKLWGGTGRLRF